MSSPSAASTAALYDGQAAEFLIGYTDAGSGGLCTLEYQETSSDTGEVECLGIHNWQRAGSPEGMVLLPESGHGMNRLGEYWAMWRSGILLYAQSARDAKPAYAPMDRSERLVDRPVVTADRELHAYSWRAEKLVRHRFSETGVALEPVWSAELAPGRTSCAPIPADRSGGVVISTVDETGDFLTARVLSVRGSKVTDVAGKTEGRYRLMPRHRMALHVGVKSRPNLAFLGISRDDESYAVLEAQFDIAKGECVWRRTRIEFLSPEQLQSAAVFHYKTQNAPEPFVLAVDAANQLIWLRKRIVQVLRENVDPSYSFPVLTSRTQRYEAIGSGASIQLVKF
ncbi:MAG TPA: hypothetical protein VFQ91_20705 [Bryobacteraceae bacterium]|nr:hypothetical protein [Bryobacteraceae bacterium]